MANVDIRIRVTGPPGASTATIVKGDPDDAGTVGAFDSVAAPAAVTGTGTGAGTETVYWVTCTYDDANTRPAGDWIVNVGGWNTAVYLEAGTNRYLDPVPAATVDANIVSVQGTAVSSVNDLDITLVSPVTEDGTKFELVQGDDYTGTNVINLTLVSATNYVGQSLVFTFIKGTFKRTYVFTILGTDETDQYCNLSFAGTDTRAWPLGDYTLQIKVRNSGKDKTVKEGTLTVKPFSAPSPTT